jgi:hypothetical protein
MSGGGTKRSVSPQDGQTSDLSRSARSQRPLESQSGFMHCTVDPGINGMKYSPLAACSLEGMSAPGSRKSPSRAEE